METIMLRGSSLDQSISPQIRNPRKIHHHSHPFISNHYENFLPPNPNTIGILPAPPPPPPPYLSHSYPPFLLQQPPLLPLPAANHRLSPAAGKKPNGGNNRTRDTSLTHKKSKSPKKLPQKPSERVVGSPTPGHIKPDPKGLPINDAKVVINKSSPGNNNMFDDAHNQVDMFSGAEMFTISPPPSSLPLPTFSLKPKLSCRTAAVVDDGATDDLRRLLRLR